MKRALRHDRPQSVQDKRILNKKISKLTLSDDLFQSVTPDYSNYINIFDLKISKLLRKILQHHLVNNVEPFIKTLKRKDIKSKLFFIEMSNEETINNFLKIQIINKLQETKKFIIIAIDKNTELNVLAFTYKLTELIHPNNHLKLNLPLKFVIRDLIKRKQQNVLVVVNDCSQCQEFVDTLTTVCDDLGEGQLAISFIVFTTKNTSDECKSFCRSLTYSVEIVSLPNDLKNHLAIQNKFVSQILFHPKLSDIFLWDYTVLDMLYHLFKTNTFRVATFQTLVKYSIMEHIDKNKEWIEFFNSPKKKLPSTIFVQKFCSVSSSFRTYVEKQVNKTTMRRLLEEPNFVATELANIHDYNKNQQLMMKKTFDVFFFVLSRSMSNCQINANLNKSIIDNKSIKTCFQNKPSYGNYKEIEEVCLSYCEDLTMVINQLPNQTSSIENLVIKTTHFFKDSYENLTTMKYRDYICEIINTLYELFGMVSLDFKEVMLYTDTCTISERINFSPMESLLNSLKYPNNDLSGSDLSYMFQCLKKVSTKIHCGDLFNDFESLFPKRGRPKLKADSNAVTSNCLTEIDHRTKDLVLRFTHSLMNFKVMELVKFSTANNGEITPLFK